LIIKLTSFASHGRFQRLRHVVIIKNFPIGKKNNLLVHENVKEDEDVPKECDFSIL
jgi:hypothetical protein